MEEKEEERREQGKKKEVSKEGKDCLFSNTLHIVYFSLTIYL